MYEYINKYSCLAILSTESTHKIATNWPQWFISVSLVSKRSQMIFHLSQSFSEIQTLRNKTFDDFETTLSKRSIFSKVTNRFVMKRKWPSPILLVLALRLFLASVRTAYLSENLIISRLKNIELFIHSLKSIIFPKTSYLLGFFGLKLIGFANMSR